MEHEVVGQLRNSSNSEYLHVFVKLSDVASVTLDTESSRPLTFDLSDAPSSTLSPRSALTHSLVTAKPVQPSPESRSAIQLPSCMRLATYLVIVHTLSLCIPSPCSLTYAFDLMVLSHPESIAHRILCQALFQ